jgi:hypothetical protein
MTDASRERTEMGLRELGRAEPGALLMILQMPPCDAVLGDMHAGRNGVLGWRLAP